MDILNEAAGTAGTETGNVEDEEYFVKAGYIAVLFLLLVYTMMGSYIESTKMGYIHETGIAIILGMVISLFAKFFGYTEINEILEFSESLFFYV